MTNQQTSENSKPHLPQTLSGIVQHGNKRGRLLGYPTANIPVKSSLDDGVYAATVTLSNQENHNALAFFGKNETFNETERKLEVHLLDFSGDLYDQNLVVNMLHFIRPSIKFSSVKELVAQMHEDEKVGREVLEGRIGEEKDVLFLLTNR